MYPNISSGLGRMMSDTLLLAGLPLVTTGRFFLVGRAALNNRSEIDAMYGSGWNDGLPMIYTTVKLAMVSCVASRGDVIFVLPDHTETISNATDLAINKAGVSIVGLGRGSLRPTFTFDTATSANIPVTVGNISIRNCIFIANFLDIVSCFTITAAPEFSVQNCEFRDTTVSLNFITHVTTTVTVNADGLDFSRNRLIITGTTAATTPIKIAGTISRVTINDNYINKAVLNNVACILAHGALVVTNLEMTRNTLISRNTDSATGGFLITTSSTTNTGFVYNNNIIGLDVAAEILISGTGHKYGQNNNLYSGDVDTSGFVSPVIGSTA